VVQFLGLIRFSSYIFLHLCFLDFYKMIILSLSYHLFSFIIKNQKNIFGLIVYYVCIKCQNSCVNIPSDYYQFKSVKLVDFRTFKKTQKNYKMYPKIHFNPPTKFCINQKLFIQYLKCPSLKCAKYSQNIYIQIMGSSV